MIPTVPIITPKLPSAVPSETKPLNVSIRLPDDLNERKNLIKMTSENPKFNSDSARFGAEIKKEKVEDSNGVIKTEKDIKEDVKETIKTELIIPVPKVRFNLLQFV